MKHPTFIETILTPHRQMLMLCGKCERKLDGGFGDDGDQSLERALKRFLRAAGRQREVRLLRVACFGVCPKRAVTLARSDRPDELLVVPAGTAMATLMERLSPCERSRTPAPDLSGSR